MGLDAVELIIRTEDEFSISISDEEASGAITVGALYQIVLAKLDRTSGCLSSKAFYITRRTLMDVLGLSRRSIRPSTKLLPLFPAETRRELWQQVHQRFGLALPMLRVPDTKKQEIYKRVLAIAGFIAILACVLGFILFLPGLLVCFLAASLWIAMSIAGMQLCERFTRSKYAIELPAETVGELAQVVLSMNPAHFRIDERRIEQSSEDVWLRLVDIICDQLQVNREEVVPTARFVDDLGVD